MLVIQVLDDRTRNSASRASTHPSRIAAQWRAAGGSQENPEGCISIDLECDGELKSLLLHALGRGYIRAGAYQPAVAALSEALTLRQQIFGHSHAAVAETELKLACAHRHASDFSKARTHIETALKILKELFGTDNVAYADALLERAVINLNANAFTEAQGDARKSASIFGRHGDVRQLQSRDIEARVELRCNLNNPANLSKVLAAYDGILADKLLGENHPWYPTFVHNQGAVHLALGEPKEAIGKFDIALKKWTGDAGEPRPEVIDLHVNRAKAFRSLRKFDEAKRDIEAALRFDRQVRGARHPYVAYDMVALARVLIEDDASKNKSHAKQYLDEAIEIYRENNYTDHGYMEAALRRRFELLAQDADKAEADRIRGVIDASCRKRDSATNC